METKLKRILITGGSGLLGTALKKILPESKKYEYNEEKGYYEYTEDSVWCPTKKEVNLLFEDEEPEFSYYEPTHIIHLAARVGGVKANSDFVSDFFEENTRMNMNVLKWGKDYNSKILSVLSTCVYPEFSQFPLTEDQLHNGNPHKSNFGYSFSKRMLDIQSRAYRQQYGLNYITVIPNNMYGIGDNFDLENGHVIPSLIRKIWEAKINNKKNVEIWGSGECLREFSYADDIAKIILHLLFRYNQSEPLNIGNTTETSIRDLALSIKRLLGYEGELIFNANKPEGIFRKPSSNENLLNTGLWKQEDYTSLEDGLRQTCEWFMKTYPNVRGINK